MIYHQDLIITPEEVEEEFARRNPKRLLLYLSYPTVFYLSKNEYIVRLIMLIYNFCN